MFSLLFRSTLLSFDTQDYYTFKGVVLSKLLFSSSQSHQEPDFTLANHRRSMTFTVRIGFLSLLRSVHLDSNREEEGGGGGIVVKCVLHCLILIGYFDFNVMSELTKHLGLVFGRYGERRFIAALAARV